MNDQTLNPSELLEISGAYWESCALHAAVNLDVFTIIGQDQLAAKEIAQNLNGDERGVATLKPGGLIMVHDFIYRLLTYEPKDENLFQVNII